MNVRILMILALGFPMFANAAEHEQAVQHEASHVAAADDVDNVEAAPMRKYKYHKMKYAKKMLHFLQQHLTAEEVDKVVATKIDMKVIKKVDKLEMLLRKAGIDEEKITAVTNAAREQMTEKMNKKFEKLKAKLAAKVAESADEEKPADVDDADVEDADATAKTDPEQGGKIHIEMN